MSTKEYINIKFAAYEAQKKKKEEIKNFFKADTLTTMCLQYKTCVVDSHKVTIFYYDIPDMLRTNGDVKYNYVILFHTTNFFKKGSFEGSELTFLKKLKDIIINDINNLKL
jgi:hypothetical protein